MTTTTDTAPPATETPAEEFARLTELPVSQRTAADNRRVRALAKKLTPATAVPATTEEKPTPAKSSTKAEEKAAEAKVSDRTEALSSREVEVAALIEKGWSRAALTRQPELAGTTIMWRIDRLTSVDVLKIDALRKRIDAEKVEPPTRKVATGGTARTAGPSRAVLIERIEKATHRLDAGITEKSVAKLRDAIGETLDLLRGDQPQGPGD